MSKITAELGRTGEIAARMYRRIGRASQNDLAREILTDALERALACGPQAEIGSSVALAVCADLASVRRRHFGRLASIARAEIAKGGAAK